MMSCYNKKGFTIVEMLIYVAILSMITVLLVVTIIQFSDVFGRARFDRKVALTAQTAMERIIRELRLAQNVGGSFTSGNPSITFNTIGKFNDEIKISVSPRTISWSGGPILLDGVALTPNDVTVTNLSFYLIDSENSFTGSQMVRVSMTVQAGQGSYQITRTYDSAALLRESY
ncbi:MAG: type II secretion system protein [bacterium]|nr:type II secretion system protein [bacterium]